MTFKLEKKGAIPKSALDTKDVFVLDVGNELFVWVGKGASAEERRRAMQYAMEYINKENKPLALPITRVLEKGESLAFWSFFSA
ncbi:hypothetical protein HK102_012541 [Quaeritorhiza haematococci]|nr:hypothetical protein HK102_012541 [Quaeritorhiza haematococci]